jgi:hypothetical protein
MSASSEWVNVQDGLLAWPVYSLQLYQAGTVARAVTSDQ